MSEELKPCPFCGSGDTHIKESKFWNGQRNDVISASVQHWCPREPGQLQSYLEIKAPTRQAAIERWNKRA